jgi:NADH:ubiquinone oxidoreductase subunit 3 (subunit A)
LHSLSAYVILNPARPRGKWLVTNFGYVGLLLIVAILFPIFILLLSFLLGILRIRPKKSSPAKDSTYECGMQTIGNSWVQFNFRYYFFALLFVAFDVVTVFLYPWAVAFKGLGSFALISMIIFIFILVIGLIYAWRKKALEWK